MVKRHPDLIMVKMHFDICHGKKRFVMVKKRPDIWLKGHPD
jgi:hypothetical protein